MSTDTFWNQSQGNLSFFKKWLGKKKSKLSAPDIMKKCKGLILGDKKVRSILFSTDLAVIENNDCDAVLAVYPFAPSQKIIETLISFSGKPVICGVGGGITKGNKTLKMAKIAENAGAVAVIVNQPFKNKDITLLKKYINIPVISSVYTAEFDFEKRIQAGVSMFHVTGGKTIDHLKEAIESNASAIVLSPLSNGELFKEVMNNYRNNVNKVRKSLLNIFSAKKRRF